MAKFNKLDVPHQWKDEFTKYPHGYTIFEALCKWVKQVDEMVDNVNDWNVYLDNFVENFEFELQEEVQSTIERWQSEGLLDDIIGSVLNTELDIVKTQIADLATLVNSTDEMKIYYSKNDADPDATYGDCTIIKYKGKVIMVDTGTVLNAQLNTLPLINDLGITHIDLFICSHYHHDHILGLEVYKNAGITVDKAIMSLAPARYPTLISTRNNALNWLSAMECTDIVTPTEGMKLVFSDAIELEFFNTDSNFAIYDNGPDEYNNYSLVFYLTYKGRKIFFAGDIEPLAEETLFTQGKIKRVDVLKAPHHGRGDTSYTLPEYKLFYDTLDPIYVMCMNYNDEGLRNRSFATGYLMRYNFHVTNNRHLIMVISGDGNIWMEQGNPYTAGITLKLTEFMDENKNSSFTTSDITFDGRSVTVNGLMFLSGAEAETQRIIGWIPDGIPLPKTRKRGPITLRGRLNGEGGLVLLFGYCNINTDGSVSINPISNDDTWVQASYSCTYSI